MDPFKLVKAVGAEFASNRAILNVQNKRTIVAQFVDGKIELTPAGKAMALEIEKKAEKKPKTAAKADASDKG